MFPFNPMLKFIDKRWTIQEIVLSDVGLFMNAVRGGWDDKFVLYRLSQPPADFRLM